MFFDPGACAYLRQGRFHGEIGIVFAFVLALLLALLEKTRVKKACRESCSGFKKHWGSSNHGYCSGRYTCS